MGHAKGALNNFSMPIYLKISNFEESNPLLWMDQYRGSSTVAGFFFVQRFFLPLSLSLSQMAFRQKPCHSGKWHLPKNLRRSLVWGSDTQFALSCPIIWQWQGNSQHLSRAGPSKAWSLLTSSPSSSSIVERFYAGEAQTPALWAGPAPLEWVPGQTSTSL